MDIIPVFRFVGMIVFAGLMLYLFFPAIDAVAEYFPTVTTATGWTLMFAMWNGIPIAVLLKETFQVLMAYQRRSI